MGINIDFDDFSFNIITETQGENSIYYDTKNMSFSDGTIIESSEKINKYIKRHIKTNIIENYKNSGKTYIEFFNNKIICRYHK
jgi:hypothetical protein